MKRKQTFVLFAKNKEAVSHKEMVSTSGWVAFDDDGLKVVNRKSKAKQFEVKEDGHGSPDDWTKFFNEDPEYNEKYSFSYVMS